MFFSTSAGQKDDEKKEVFGVEVDFKVEKSDKSITSGARVWEKREERSWLDAPIPQSMGGTCGPKQKKRRGTTKYKYVHLSETPYRFKVPKVLSNTF